MTYFNAPISSIVSGMSKLTDHNSLESVCIACDKVADKYRPSKSHQQLRFNEHIAYVQWSWSRLLYCLEWVCSLYTGITHSRQCCNLYLALVGTMVCHIESYLTSSRVGTGYAWSLEQRFCSVCWIGLYIRVTCHCFTAGVSSEINCKICERKRSKVGHIVVGNFRCDSVFARIVWAY